VGGGAARIALRWPGWRSDLRPLRDAHLADLCEAYETACAAAELWLKSTAETAPARAEEYRRLAAEVANEILRALASGADAQQYVHAT
jgi:hypothetical protein